MPEMPTPTPAELPPPTDTGGTPSDEGTAAQPPSTDWKAESRKWERQAKANAEAAKRLEEIEASSKSETEKLAESNAALKREAETARLELMRWKIGTAAQLPAEAIARLQGSDEDELTADAEKLAQLFTPATPPVAGPPAERLRPGTSGNPPEDAPDPKKLAASVLERRYS